MRWDLNGSDQAAVCELNAPRLAEALAGIAELTDAETDLDDPTLFGVATATGIDNWLDDDGMPDDITHHAR